MVFGLSFVAVVQVADDAEQDTADEYFFFILFSVILAGLMRVFAIARQVSL